MSRNPNSYQRALQLFANPRFLTLVAVLLVAVLLLAFLAGPLMPFLIALVLAYFLDGGVKRLLRWRNSRGLAVGIVFTAFLLAYVLALLGPVQLAVRQTLLLARNFPEISAKLQQALLELGGYLEGFLPLEQQQRLTGILNERMHEGGQVLLSHALGAIPEVTTWLVYLFLIPLVVFFFLKDKEALLNGFVRLLPRERELVQRIWEEVEGKTASYVRGKVWEILLVGTLSSLAFLLLGFDYPAMLGLLSGLSVLVPLVGAIGVAVPLAVLGYVQWGMEWELGWLMIAYVVIQQLDMNIFAPLILSGAVKLHPVLILLGVVVFGSLWGFWGVFFAIPLATLAKSILDALMELNAEQKT